MTRAFQSGTGAIMSFRIATACSLSARSSPIGRRKSSTADPSLWNSGSRQCQRAWPGLVSWISFFSFRQSDGDGRFTTNLVAVHVLGNLSGNPSTAEIRRPVVREGVPTAMKIPARATPSETLVETEPPSFAFFSSDPQDRL